MKLKSIYLDHAATTPLRPEAAKAMAPHFSETFGNASSVHLFGQSAKKALADARQMVADCIGADASEIYFTSGGTESDNLAIKGIAQASKNQGRHLITSPTEHHAVLSTCRYLEEEGYEVSYLPVDEFGVIDPEALKNTIRPDTILVTVMLGNNETGALQPIPELAKITRANGIPFHTDAVQAVGKIPVDVAELGVDLLSIAAHKRCGPKGVGALYVRDGTQIEPLLHGGHQEHGKRAGTENVAAIVGFAKALELATQDTAAAPAHLADLRDRLEFAVTQKIPDVYLNGDPQQRLPHILNLRFNFVKGESLCLALDMRGIAVSTGSACTSGALESSHVLQAMGIDPVAAEGSIRFSFGRENTVEEIDFVADVLAESVQQLRKGCRQHDRDASLPGTS